MISIIVPVYNVAKFLPQCLDSILEQTYQNIEIILVNDASPDNSLMVCEFYQKKDPRVRIIDKKINEGVEKARLTGLDAATGEYIMFVDSDDWLEGVDVLALMHQKAEETQADYVDMVMQRVMDRHKWIKSSSQCSVTGLIEQPELFDKYYISFFGVNILAVNMAGKLYRKSVLEKVNLAPLGLCMGEDLVFNLRLFPHLKCIYIMDKVGYNYRFGGMTTRYNKHLYPDLKRLYLLKEQLIEQYQYNKAFDFIRIEIKNVFLSDICQRIIFKTGSAAKIKSVISHELEDPIWGRVLQVREYPNFLADPFVVAIANKDADTIYDICLERVKKDAFKRCMKRIASFVFTHL